MRVLPYGAAAVLIEPDDAASVPALAAALRDLPDVLEAVPGARTVLVRTSPTALASVRERVAGVVPGLAAADAQAAPIELAVTYDGADLAAVAAEADLDVDGVVRLHTAPTYVVAFCGFVPGFAYLTGLDQRLRLPRLPEPRTRVPAGAVGVAGEFTGAYPRASPGGWRLLGRTEARLWDTYAVPPALLTPGTTVRFRAVR